MEGILSLFGNTAAQSGVMQNLMKLLGNEGFAKLLGAGIQGYGAYKTGNMLDFQKNLMKKADQRQDILFAQDQEDRQRNKNLDFDYNYQN